ncbi:helix-turn-helix domain-containing protein [Legionella sp. W05-934-2]|jgi:transcriptional regulator with XRE-family HTH domain|uniref:helix-turn-helix domain-containing protein n=1 Tax=Legionella sp. W05-934-2 TaxID=1198649 RepID=UPI00346358CA
MGKVDLSKQFAQRLIQSMNAAGFTSNRSTVGVDVYKLAEITGYSSVICRKYLKGEAIPEPTKLMAIADALNVSPGWLLFGDPDKDTRFSNDNAIISKNLLQYLFECAHPLYHVGRSPDEIAHFLVELVNDISQIKADEDQSKKIIDLAIASVTQFAR